MRLLRVLAVGYVVADVAVWTTIRVALDRNGEWRWRR